MLTQHQLELIEGKVQDVINLAQDIYDVDLGYVDIDMSLKGRIAGKAQWKYNRALQISHSFMLRFNQEAFTKDWDMMFNDTIPHEVAHLVCAANPRIGDNHNEGWRRCCVRLGGSGETYHKLQLTPGRKTKRFIYTATCGTDIELSHVLHNKIQAKVHSRTVRATGGKVDYHCSFVQTYKK